MFDGSALALRGSVAHHLGEAFGVGEDFEGAQELGVAVEEGAGEGKE